MAKSKPIRIDEYESAQLRYEQNSAKSSWSAEKRANGRNRFSDEMVPDVCGYESEQDWTQDAM